MALTGARVMKIAGAAGLVTQRATPAAVGQYVKAYDPDANDGRGQLVTTADLAEALVFADAGEALEFWRQPSTVDPVREDGKPNRPLTAFHVSIEPLDAAS